MTARKLSYIILLLLILVLGFLAGRVSYQPFVERELAQDMPGLKKDCRFTIMARDAYIEEHDDNLFLVLTRFNHQVSTSGACFDLKDKRFSMRELTHYWFNIFKATPPKVIMVGDMGMKKSKVSQSLTLLYPRIVNNKTLEFSILPENPAALSEGDTFSDVSIVLYEDWELVHRLPQHTLHEST